MHVIPEVCLMRQFFCCKNLPLYIEGILCGAEKSGRNSLGKIDNSI